MRRKFRRIFLRGRGGYVITRRPKRDPCVDEKISERSNMLICTRTKELIRITLLKDDGGKNKYAINNKEDDGKDEEMSKEEYMKEDPSINHVGQKPEWE